MTAAGTTAVSGAAAKVVPGAALTPCEVDARADYQQERIALLAGLCLATSSFFLITGWLHQAWFFPQHSLLQGTLDLALFVHLAVGAFQAVLWATARKRLWGATQLPLLEATLVLGSLGARAYEVWHLQLAQGHHLRLLMCMTTLAALMCRAVIVPSAPRWTLILGGVGVIPALALAFFEGRERGAAAEALSFSGSWCVLAVVLSTFTSKIIYGLRRRAHLHQQLGQYVIERKLGEGGMGEVYLARHSLLRRPTALKLLPPERAGHGTIARFEREVRATSRLSHPNTVAIYDYGRTEDGIFYYAMEHLEGCDLQSLVEQQGPLCASRVVHVLSQIAGALVEAHAAGLVHRDLKPANVFLCERGGLKDTVKVLDFGLVKETGLERAGTAQTDVNVLLGTPAYLAPEAIHSPAAVDARSDLYAVGALGYFLLTGHDVFEGNSAVALCIAHLHELPVSPSSRIGRPLPADLERLILGCLEKEPERRPASAAALRRALLACDVPPWEPDQRRDEALAGTGDATAA
jgi:serine/threonine-protein kinase